MSMDATRQWLLENTKNRFHSPQRVYGLVVSALSEYRSLQPKLAEYVGEDKRRQALLCLHGTLPVVFNGATFNIPVVFWFPQRFPEHPPLAYVTPTRTMVVKVSKHVDERGRIYHPYLADWSDTSALGELFRNLIGIFSAEPPVYSRPPGHTPVTMSPAMGPPSPALGSMSATTLPLGVPVSMAASQQQDSVSMSMSMPHVGFAASQNLGAVRPMTSAESDLASVHAGAPTPSGHTTVAPKAQTSDSANASADSIEQDLGRISLDPHPQVTPVSATPTVTNELAHVQSPQQQEYRFNPVAGRPPIPMLSPVAADTSKFSDQSMSPLPAEQEAASPNVAATNLGGYPSPTASNRVRPSTADTASASINEQSNQSQPELHEQAAVAAATAAAELKATMAVPVAPPPPPEPSTEPDTPVTATASVTRPPAPKSPVTSSLLDSEPMDDPKKRLIGYQIAIYDRVTEAVDKSREKHTRLNKELLDQSANLNSGAGVIAEERRQLLDSQRQLSSNISVLEKKLNELNEKKAEFPDAANVTDVRLAFRGQTPAMEQLFDLAGEIAAIDDTLYVLGKALNDGKLSIATYMRQVRKLAQQQFMAKALALKIRGLCALDG
ncbi:suppressor protein stp22 of temperature-sensitive alpha-factor receptor and arginine permease [Coemansia aciculifera]|uniref:Suppressor protein stp22 of temperature-sensitive alpha-factor receptor and arginine permease n=1 Tax=Coemansia aciculifera TaxID=417176 RepID=A0A9W8M8T7_9FUNG|nr:suppressor protein stp22 of temperature-sensitive alpha-factor receptor and arginine permease [Coemansia aciculifera]KAJ2870377.1 suppressor protein stp22 of temperature-sensitive alpha-factor receptor and arginine permease [Coemansia aciculifera]